MNILVKSTYWEFRKKNIFISEEAAEKIVALSYALSKTSIASPKYFLNKLIADVSNIYMEYESDCIHGFF